MTDTSPSPPVLAEKLLSILMLEAEREFILGDFAEEFSTLALNNTTIAARIWYWIELIKSIPALLYLRISRTIRSNQMKKINAFALIGAILLLPAAFLVVGGVAQSGFGSTAINNFIDHDLFFFHPALILGGMALALGLNLIPILKLQFQEGVVTSTLTLKGRLLNVLLIASILLFAGVIFLYLLAENIQIFMR